MDKDIAQAFQEVNEKLKPLADLPQRMERVEHEIDDLNVRLIDEFRRIDQRFEQIDQRFEQIDQRFEQVDERFDSLADEISQTVIRRMEMLFEHSASQTRLFLEEMRGQRIKLDEHDHRIEALERKSA